MRRFMHERDQARAELEKLKRPRPEMLADAPVLSMAVLRFVNASGVKRKPKETLADVFVRVGNCLLKEWKDACENEVALEKEVDGLRAERDLAVKASTTQRLAREKCQTDSARAIEQMRQERDAAQATHDTLRKERDELTALLEQVTAPKPEPGSCPKCGADMRAAICMRCALDVDRPKLLLTLCPHCGARTVNELARGADVEYICSECGKTFRR